MFLGPHIATQSGNQNNMFVAIGYFWPIQKTFIILSFVSANQNIFGEAVLRPLPAAPGGNCPPLLPLSYANE